MPPHPLTNFQIQKYCENKPKFNSVYSRDNLPNKIKDAACIINLDEYAACIINLDEYSDISTHWIVLYVKNNDITYFDSFGVEHIPKEIIKFIGRSSLIKNIKANIFGIQA